MTDHDHDEIPTRLRELAAAHIARDKAIVALGDQLSRLRAACRGESEALEAAIAGTARALERFDDTDGKLP